MKVKKLIEELKKFDPDQNVKLFDEIMYSAIDIDKLVAGITQVPDTVVIFPKT